MNRRVWWKRAVCISLAVLLLLIFCWVSHSCDHSHCPVCMLTAAFRLSLGLITLVMGLVFRPGWAHCMADLRAKAKGGECTLVALKVKLSD